MIPKVFVSSTIDDLHHLRDSIRDTINEIGFIPVMSEYGDIGYLPEYSVEESCYLAIKECQLAIFIIGKRYGDIKEGLSITHEEFRTARKLKLPILFLVMEEILSFKKIFDVNKDQDALKYPGMQNPLSTFEFINEFINSETNNGLLSFTTNATAKQNLKRQIAHIVGDLLKKEYDPIQSEVKDILTEIKTLSHILLKNEKELARKFATAFRLLLNQEYDMLKSIMETVFGSLSEAVPEIFINDSFRKLLETNGVTYKVDDSLYKILQKLYSSSSDYWQELNIQTVAHSELPYLSPKQRSSLNGVSDYNIIPKNPKDKSVIYAYGKNNFITNSNADQLLGAMYERLLKSLLFPINTKIL